MKVGWINVLPNPGQAASATNPIVGRVAYWVDDDSCKVNINTANGSHKNDTAAMMNTNQKYSYGFGVPSEISLQALSNSTGTFLSSANADAIATYAATTNFNSTAEIQQVPGLPTNFYIDNKFNLTYTSRSPELNLFGEPRIYLFPVGTPSDGSGTLYNMMTGPYGPYVDNAGASEASATTEENTWGPIDFIYPTQSQLPSTPQQYLATYNRVLWSSSLANYPLGLRLAHYLNGLNSQGQAINWPKFAGSTTTGPSGAVGPSAKYSPRQLDSITLQIMELADGKNVMADQIDYMAPVAYMRNGFLSGDPVSGLARGVKLTEIYIQANALAGSPPAPSARRRAA
ncbi:MAG: hypothetical protein WDO13_07960 [Verrucomicrobiota bacterium]